MKYLCLLVLLLLSLLAFNTVLIEAGEAIIGPGIDSNLPGWQEVKYGPNGDAPFTEFYIEFDAPTTAEYTFHLGFGVLEDNADGMIRFILTDTSLDNVIKEHIVVVSGSIEYHDEELFTVNLTSGKYRIWIVKTSNDDDISDFNGTIILWIYDKGVDPSVSYYWLEDYEQWFVMGDIAWYATYSGISGGVPIPQVKVINRWQDTEGVHYTLKLWNWKNGTTVRIQQIDSYYKTLKNEYVYDIPNSSYVVVNVTLEYISPGDQLIARGYGIDGAYHRVLIKVFNETYEKKTWLEIVKDWFNAVLSYVGFIYAVVTSIIPYAGIFYFLALVGAFFNCIKEISLMPLYDFFYKQYVALMNITSLTIKIAEKLYQATKTFIEWLARVATIIASLFG